jgi:hypothetical protein
VPGEMAAVDDRSPAGIRRPRQLREARCRALLRPVVARAASTGPAVPDLDAPGEGPQDERPRLRLKLPFLLEEPLEAVEDPPREGVEFLEAASRVALDLLPGRGRGTWARRGLKLDDRGL